MENEKRPGTPEERPAPPPQEMPAGPAPSAGEKVRYEEKGEKKGVFARLKTWKNRRKEETWEEPVDDIYYGIQFRPLEENENRDRRTISGPEGDYAALFTREGQPNEEMTQRLARLQQQRRERVRAAMEEAGESLEEVDAEFGYGFAAGTEKPEKSEKAEEEHKDSIRETALRDALRKPEKEPDPTPEPMSEPPAGWPENQDGKISFSPEETRNHPVPLETGEPEKEEDLQSLLSRLEKRSDLLAEDKKETADFSAVHSGETVPTDEEAEKAGEETAPADKEGGQAEKETGAPAAEETSPPENEEPAAAPEKEQKLFFPGPAEKEPELEESSPEGRKNDLLYHLMKASPEPEKKEGVYSQNDDLLLHLMTKHPVPPEPEKAAQPVSRKEETVISFASLLEGKGKEEDLSSLNEELKRASHVSFEDLLRPTLLDTESPLPQEESEDVTGQPDLRPEEVPEDGGEEPVEISSWSDETGREPDPMEKIRQEAGQEIGTESGRESEQVPEPEAGQENPGQQPEALPGEEAEPPQPASETGGEPQETETPKEKPESPARGGEPKRISIPIALPAAPKKPKEKKPAPAKTGRSRKKAHTAPDPTVYREPRPTAPVPEGTDLLQGMPYAPQETPVHLVPLDALDSALRAELRCYASENAPVKKKKKKEKNRKADQTMKGKFSLGGTEEEGNVPEEEIPSDSVQEELEDYTGAQDIESIRHELRGDMRELLLRTLVTGICTVLLIVLGFLCEFSVFGDVIAPGVPLYITYMVMNLALYLVAVVFCLRTVGNGLRSLVHLQASADSGLAAAVVAVLVQNVVLCFCYQQVSSGSLHLYSTLAVLALFLNSWGKMSMVRRIWANFRYVSSADEKWAVQLYDRYNMALRLSRGCVVDAPVIAYQRRTNFLSHFLAHSYDPDPAESSAQTLAPIGVLASLALCIGCLVLTRDVPSALSALSAGMCVCVPFTALMSVNLPVARLCTAARRFGSMISGYQAVDRFSRVNALMVDSHDLFPEGAVILNGIHTFGQQRIDQALMDATALMAKIGGEMNDVFSAVIRNRQEALPRVERPVYEDGRGVVGWVNGRRIMVGNRDLLAAHHIDPPSRDFEGQHRAGGNELLYLAVGGELVALLQLQYRVDERRVRQLQRMEVNGISLIVRTHNPHITGEFLCERLHLDANSVKVLSEDLGQEYDRVTEGMSEEGEALFATRGRAVSMMRLLPGCVRLHSQITLLVAMQNVGVILGFVLVALLACYSGMGQLTTLSLLLYEGFWILASLLVPRFHKP